VIAAEDQFGVVFESDPVRRLDRDPLVEDRRARVAPVTGLTYQGAVDRVADVQIGDRFVAPICRQDRCFATGTVRTRVTASAKSVDRPPERHLGRIRHAVEDRLGADFVEAGLDRLGCVEVAHHRLLAISG